MERIFNECCGVNERILEGYTVAKVRTGIFKNETGMVMELEREIVGATLGIDIVYDPNKTENEMDFAISSEYVKRICD